MLRRREARRPDAVPRARCRPIPCDGTKWPSTCGYVVGDGWDRIPRRHPSRPELAGIRVYGDDPTEPSRLLGGPRFPLPIGRGRCERQEDQCGQLTPIEMRPHFLEL